MNFIPPSLWTIENTPFAVFLPDPDSMDDAFTLPAYVYASTPGVNLTLLTDSIRNGPAQLVDQMLTLPKSPRAVRYSWSVPARSADQPVRLEAVPGSVPARGPLPHLSEIHGRRQSHFARGESLDPR